MPGLDRTGPQGQGSRTGRQMGKCTSPGKSRKSEKDPEGTTGTDPQNETNEEFDLNGPGPFRGRGFGHGAGWGPGKSPGRGMGRGGGRFRRRNREN